MNKLLCGLMVTIGMSISLSAVTKVGNADEGADLEKLKPVRSGILKETRQEAIALLQRLSVEGIPGLGALSPELTRSEMFIADKDVNAFLESDKEKFHSSLNGQVFARTIAEPYSPTRFFPSKQAFII